VLPWVGVARLTMVAFGVEVWRAVVTIKGYS
jgi:hypothetical protein